MATASHLVWFAHTHSPSRDRPPPASASTCRSHGPSSASAAPASTLPARAQSLPRAGCFGAGGLGGCLPSCTTKSSRTLSTLGGGEGEGFLAPPSNFAAVAVEKLAEDEEDGVDIAQSSASSSSSEAAAAGERSSTSTSSPAVSPRPLDAFLAACDRALAAQSRRQVTPRRAGPGGEAGRSAAVGPFPQEPKKAQLEDIQVRFENIKKQKNEDNPERAQPLPPTEFLIGSDLRSSRQERQKKKGLQEEVEANPGAAGSTIPPGRQTDRPSPPAASFAAGPLLLAAGASLPPPPPQAEWGAMGKVEGWLGGGGAKPKAAVQLPEDSAESSATRVDVDVGSGSEETAEHAAAAKIQDAWRRSPQRIRPEDSASNVGSALSQHTAKSGPGSAQGARLGFVLAAWGVAAVATVAKAAVSKARAAARPPKVRYQRHCFAPKFADRLNAPTVCVRVPEQIVIDLRADPKVMQVPTLEIQQPSPRPPKALAPSK